MRTIVDVNARVAAARQRGLEDCCGWIIASEHGIAERAREHAAALGITCSTIDDLRDELVPATRYLQRLAVGAPPKDTAHHALPSDQFEEPALEWTELGKPNKKGERAVHRRSKEALEYLTSWLDDPSRPALVVLGDYGSGKTTLLEQFARLLATQSLNANTTPFWLPILVSLRDFGAGADLQDLVTRSLAAEGCDLDWPQTHELIRKGVGVLLLDGFDEMVRSSGRSVVLASFKRLSSFASSNAKVVISCRTHFFRDQREFDETIGNYDELDNPLLSLIRQRVNCGVVEITPFSDRQVKHFVERRLGAEAAPVMRRIESTYNLLDLARRPVLGDMIVRTLPYLEDKRGALTSAAQIYEAYVAQWIDADDWRSVMTPLGKQLLMEAVATRMFLSPEGVKPNSLHWRDLPAPKPELLKSSYQLLETIPSIGDLFEHDTRTCSFLNRDDAGNYMFIHKSFQEYFAACWLAKTVKSGDVSSLLRFTTSVDSPEVRDFFLAMLGSPDRLVEVSTTLLRDPSGARAFVKLLLPPLLRGLSPRSHVALALIVYEHVKVLSANGDSLSEFAREWLSGRDVTVDEILPFAAKPLTDPDAYGVISIIRHAFAAEYPSEACARLAYKYISEAVESREYTGFTGCLQQLLVVWRSLDIHDRHYTAGPGDRLPIGMPSA